MDLHCKTKGRIVGEGAGHSRERVNGAVPRGTAVDWAGTEEDATARWAYQARGTAASQGLPVY